MNEDNQAPGVVPSQPAYKPYQPMPQVDPMDPQLQQAPIPMKKKSHIGLILTLIILVVVLGGGSAYGFYYYQNLVGVKTIGDLIVKQLDFSKNTTINDSSGNLSMKVTVDDSAGVSKFTMDTAAKATSITAKSADIDGTTAIVLDSPYLHLLGQNKQELSLHVIYSKGDLFFAADKLPSAALAYEPQISQIYTNGTWVRVSKDMLAQVGEGLTGSSIKNDPAKQAELNQKYITDICGAPINTDNWASKSIFEKHAIAGQIDACLDGAVYVKNITNTGSTMTVTIAFSVAKIDALAGKAYAACKKEAQTACGTNTAMKADEIAAAQKVFDAATMSIDIGNNNTPSGYHASLHLDAKAISDIVTASGSTVPTSVKINSFDGSMDETVQYNTGVTVTAPENFIDLVELMAKYQMLQQQQQQQYNKPTTTPTTSYPMTY